MGKSAAKRRRRKAQGGGDDARRGADGCGDGTLDGGEADETSADDKGGPEAEQEPPKAEDALAETPTATGHDVVASPNCSLQQQQSDLEQVQSESLAMSMVEAKRVLQRFFSVLLMASLSPHAAIKPLCGNRVAIKEIQGALAANGWRESLLPIEEKALGVAGLLDLETNTIDPQPVYDVVGAVAFKVELCEFQVRAQARGNAAGKASRGRSDVQRVVSRLVNGYLSDEEAGMTPAKFGSMVEEKLGLSMGNWLATILFARIMCHPFTRSFSQNQQTDRLSFIDALERFCLRAEFSLDCLEGQIRELVNKHSDLHKVFRDMDADGSGTISGEELVAFLQREAHVEYPVDVLMAFIKRFDADGNGSLDYREFVDFVRPNQFGIQVLSPFGLFYLPLDRSTPMKEATEKIRTRMFWLQHNDLLAKTAAESRKPQSVKPGAAKKETKPTNAPPKLKVTEQFRLTRHFGTLPVTVVDTVQVGCVFENGELVVLVSSESEAPSSDNTLGGQSYDSPKFEYRFKPSTKRNIPTLFVHSTLLANSG